jgi:CheY-like chemotaxis protein
MGFTLGHPGVSPSTKSSASRVILDERISEPTPREEWMAEAKPMSLKVMIVDDEAKTPRLMRALAAPLGHMVLALEDYQAARQRSERQRFDAVFVGMRLPSLDGLELARRIRNSEPNRDTFIVMLSATDDIPSLRTAFGEGADLVLTKPVSSDCLLRMLGAMDLPGWKGKRHAARLPLFADVACLWNGQPFSLRSLNISESGLLLQPSLGAEVGQEVAVTFKIPDVGASLNVRARIVRKEGSERFAVEFVELAPEHRNAIQLYVTGRLKELTSPRDLSGIGMRRLFRP